MEVNTAPVNAFIYFDKLIKIQFVAISFLYFAHCCFDYYNVIAVSYTHLTLPTNREV